MGDSKVGQYGTTLINCRIWCQRYPTRLCTPGAWLRSQDVRVSARLGQVLAPRHHSYGLGTTDVALATLLPFPVSPKAARKGSTTLSYVHFISSCCSEAVGNEISCPVRPQVSTGGGLNYIERM